jgi:glycosyltransferase involved in cell wall biosynthesis
VKFSLLLPTRNGGELLEDVLHSVLDEPYADMELVVSNNASQDATGEVLERFRDDQRLQVLTLEEPVEVTDNWRAALDQSSGDYLSLIGDDDLLLPRYFERASSLLERHGMPDVLSFNAYGFAFPGFAGSALAHYADPFYENDPSLPREAAIPRAQRMSAVRDVFRFEFPMHLNMQCTLIARRAVERLSDGLLKPPFPDFYALNALLMRAESWVHTDERLLVVGVSPKSFGRTIHSASEQGGGLDYLGIETGFPGQLPGSEIANGTYRCLLQLKQDYPQELDGVEIDRGHYLAQQINAWYIQLRLGSLSVRDVLRRLRLLSPRDWLAFMRLLAPRLTPGRLRARLSISRKDPASQLWPGMRPLSDVSNITEFAAWIASDARTRSGTPQR